MYHFLYFPFPLSYNAFLPSTQVSLSFPPVSCCLHHITLSFSIPLPYCPLFSGAVFQITTFRQHVSYGLNKHYPRIIYKKHLTISLYFGPFKNLQTQSSGIQQIVKMQNIYIYLSFLRNLQDIELKRTKLVLNTNFV